MKKIFLILTGLIAFNFADAQKNTVERSTTTVYVGTNVKVKKKSEIKEKQCVKLNLVDFIGGKYGLYYEKKLPSGLELKLVVV